MDRAQYLCMKAVRAEVDSLLSEGWEQRSKHHHPAIGAFYWLEHPIRGHITIQTNARLTSWSLYKNGKLKKCQKYGV